MNDQERFTIGDLAKQVGICVETIRYYHRIGLMTLPPMRSGRRMRAYSQHDVQQIRFIKRTQHLGFSLGEIRMLLQLANANNCAEVRAVGHRKLLDLDERLSKLLSMRDTLKALLEQCEQTGADASCPLMEVCMRKQSERVANLHDRRDMGTEAIR